jgi:putative RNA 2'-phosphotransferase
MDEHRMVKISKYLSKHLRHSPERIGLVLEEGGWVSVDDLLAACNARGMKVSRQELDIVVAENDKKRFSFNADKTRIRANQGHSVEVDLGLVPQKPPDLLYHGTSQQTAEAIREQGLLKMNRQHVHLSAETATAIKVGARHGKPFVFMVDAVRMYADGHVFYCSDNGVWLIDHVPPMYLLE